jgi:hypothetical protein
MYLSRGWNIYHLDAVVGQMQNNDKAFCERADCWSAHNTHVLHKGIEALKAMKDRYAKKAGQICFVHGM